MQERAGRAKQSHPNRKGSQEPLGTKDRMGAEGQAQLARREAQGNGQGEGRTAAR